MHVSHNNDFKPNTSGHCFPVMMYIHDVHDVYMTSYMHVAHAKAHDNES
jgi:hypothetical protein